MDSCCNNSGKSEHLLKHVSVTATSFYDALYVNECCLSDWN